MRAGTLLVALAMACAAALPGRAADRMGVVLLHGKTGELVKP